MQYKTYRKSNKNANTYKEYIAETVGTKNVAFEILAQ